MKRESTISIGENRGRPRIWLEGKWLAEVCKFTAGQRVTTTFESGVMTIRPAKGKEVGDHKVAERRGRLILDYIGGEIRTEFENVSRVSVVAKRHHITITAEKS